VGSGAKPQPPTILVHFQADGTMLVAFKMHGLKHHRTSKNSLSLRFYEEVFKQLTSSI